MKPEQERLTTVLQDTITLLCKNSLNFDKQLVIQGLIVVTTDTEEVLVVQVNDNVGVPAHVPCVTSGHAKEPPPQSRKRAHQSDEERSQSPSKSLKREHNYKSSNDVEIDGGNHSEVQVKSECDVSDDEDLIFVDEEIKSESFGGFNYEDKNSVNSSGLDNQYITGVMDNSSIAGITAAGTSSHFQGQPSWPKDNTTAASPTVSQAVTLLSSTLSCHPPSQKLYHCDKCTAVFGQGEHLKQHALSSHGEGNCQPYACTWPVCDKTFGWSGNLSRHMRLHTNQKPVACQLCDYRCRNHSSLGCHLRSAHGLEKSDLVRLSMPADESNMNSGACNALTESQPKE